MSPGFAMTREQAIAQFTHMRDTVTRQRELLRDERSAIADQAIAEAGLVMLDIDALSSEPETPAVGDRRALLAGKHRAIGALAEAKVALIDMQIAAAQSQIDIAQQGLDEAQSAIFVPHGARAHRQ